MLKQIKTKKYLYVAVVSLVLAVVFGIMRQPLLACISNSTGCADGENSFLIYSMGWYISSWVFIIFVFLLAVFSLINYKNAKP